MLWFITHFHKPKEPKFPPFLRLFQLLFTILYFLPQSLFNYYHHLQNQKHRENPESCSLSHSPPLTSPHHPKLHVLHPRSLVFYNLPDPRARDPSKPGVWLGLQPLPSFLGTAPEHLRSPEKHTKPTGLGCHSRAQGKTEIKKGRKY